MKQNLEVSKFEHKHHTISSHHFFEFFQFGIFRIALQISREFTSHCQLLSLSSSWQIYCQATIDPSQKRKWRRQLHPSSLFPCEKRKREFLSTTNLKLSISEIENNFVVKFRNWIFQIPICKWPGQWNCGEEIKLNWQKS